MKATQWGEPGRSAFARRCVGLLIGLTWGCTLTLLSPQGAFASGFGYGGETNDGPVRLARVVYTYGDVSWRADSNLSWSACRRNMPLRQGAQIWVPSGCRSEIQFDDGSRLRLGDNALVTFQTFYSDRDGEFTEITLNDGEAAFRLRHDKSVYQVNTPTISIEARGPARFRCGAGSDTQLAVYQGRCSCEGKRGKTTLLAGDYLDLRDPNSPYEIRPLPAHTRFDNWCDARDRVEDGYTRRHAYRRLPPNIATVSDGLDDYGSWRTVPRYGEVWCPRVGYSNWRPYRHGHWCWVDPYGWTWVSDEPWGWAPYHYGSWVHLSFGWGWCPGPRYQYWSPGVVSFTEYGGSVGWCPLSPAEVVYPASLSIGFRSGDWSLFFSIGQAAVYYPTSRYVFVADPWPVSYCNRFAYYGGGTTIINNTTIVRNFTTNNNTFISDPRFVPLNARSGGAILADRGAFTGRGDFRLASSQQAVTAFSRGRMIAAPSSGRMPVAGPISARPTADAITPTRNFRSTVPISRTALDRPVYRAPVRSEIARTSAPLARTLPTNPSPQVLPRTGAAGRIPGDISHGGAQSGTNPVGPNGGNIAQPGGTSHHPGISARTAVGAAAVAAGAGIVAERARRARANVGMRTTAGGGNKPSGAAPGANRITSGGGRPGGNAAERAARARTSLGIHPGAGGGQKTRIGAGQGVVQQPGRRPLNANARSGKTQIGVGHAQPRERRVSGNAVSGPPQRTTQNQPVQRRQPIAQRRQPNQHGGGGRVSGNPAPRTVHKHSPAEQSQMRAYRRPIRERIHGAGPSPRGYGGQGRFPQAPPVIRERRAPIERVGRPSGGAPRSGGGPPHGGGGQRKEEGKRKHGG